MPRSRRIILVGGGSSHVEVLRLAARRPFGGELVLVSPDNEHLYHGLLPAQLRGAIPDSALAIDLRALCAEANARWVQGPALRIEASRDAVVVHTAGEPVTGDVCSIDIGCVDVDGDAPGVREFAYTLHPQARWRSLVRLMGEVMRSGASAPVSCCVVGGGASGVELLLAMLARARTAGQTVSATLVTSGEDILENVGPRAAARVRTLLLARGVRVLTGRTATRVDADCVHLDDGTQVPSALTIWTTGAAAPPLLRESELPVDADGYLKVDASLRTVTGLPVFGAGDCVSLVESPFATRGGAYAMREAPVLAANLHAMLSSPPSEPRLYEAQQPSLTIMDTSDDRALLYWRGWSAHARWVLRMKQRLDARWMARYQPRDRTR